MMNEPLKNSCIYFSTLAVQGSPGTPTPGRFKKDIEIEVDNDVNINIDQLQFQI